MSLQITLPETPVNGYEVTYFSIAYDRLQSYRLKYHTQATWQEVCGDDRRGAHFTDEWQVFEGDYFKGRILGWDITNRFQGDDYFELRENAESALRQRLLRRAEFHEEQAKGYRAKASELDPCQE
jgi:hypothetical protein